MSPFLIFLVFFPISLNAFYYKRNTYGDAGANPSAVDYVNSYYGLPSLNQPSELRRRPPFGLYPPQQFFRREHPFDFGPVAHRIGGANENVPEEQEPEQQQQQAEPQPQEIPSTRENAMKKAKPGLWRRGESIRSEIQQKHEQIRRQLAEEGADIREKLADLHKRLVAKNLKLMRVTLKKMDREDNKKKQPKNEEKLNLKAPENVETTPVEEKKQEKEEVTTEMVEQINDQGPIAQPLIQPQYPSQQSFSVVESRPIRVSQDGQTIEI